MLGIFVDRRFALTIVLMIAPTLFVSMETTNSLLQQILYSIVVDDAHAADNFALRRRKESKGYTLHADMINNNAFPRWGDSESSINVSNIMDYMSDIFKGRVEGHHKPTSIYFIDGNWTLWTSQKLRKQHSKLIKRIRPSERLALQSIRTLKRTIDDSNTQDHPWPVLEQTIRNGGFIFMVYHKDFNGCNYQNWKRPTFNNPKLSIPIFTLSARLDCNYAFPWPTYETVALSKSKKEDWIQQMSDSKATYSNDHSKKRAAIWRGSLTGTNNKFLADSVRWQLCKISQAYPGLLDAGLVKIPSWRTDANLSEVGGLVPPMNMQDFQHYEAVIDVDGNAWSSRFAALLCMDSVVLKVQPTMVDYFHHSLIPWTHYIPVKADLSDLVEKIEWVVNFPNKTRDIVANANDWCSQNMIIGSLARDLLNIWNSYTELLHFGDDVTRGQYWKDGISSYFDHDNEIVIVESLL